MSQVKVAELRRNNIRNNLLDNNSHTHIACNGILIQRPNSNVLVRGPIHSNSNTKIGCTTEDSSANPIHYKNVENLMQSQGAQIKPVFPGARSGRHNTT